MRNLRCFNPRTRVGCDLRSVTSITLWMMFQSTHPRGVRHVVYHDVDPSTVVSIHAPAWGATLDYSQRATFFAFQSTHPRGVRLGTMVFIGSFTSFNPRTRVGCDGADNTTLPSSPVSIHAPAWGATPCSCDSRELRRVSIHAPAWGATVMVIDKLAYTFVSIHAPAWGATAAIVLRDASVVFQSTHPRGVRLTFVSVVTKARCFNPRTRVGCDESKQLSIRQLNRFNPRTRVGCDALSGFV